VNDPVYGPATRPEGRRGRSRPGFRSWRSARRSAADRGEDSSRKQTRIEDRFASPGPDKRAVNVALLEVYKRATCSVRNATDADAPTHILRERWRACRVAGGSCPPPALTEPDLWASHPALRGVGVGGTQSTSADVSIAARSYSSGKSICAGAMTSCRTRYSRSRERSPRFVKYALLRVVSTGPQ